MAQQHTVNSDFISEVTRKEKDLTHQANPVKGGPTAQAQKHAGDKLSDGHVVSDIAKGEENITHHGGPVPDGPGAFAAGEATRALKDVRLPF